MQPSPELPPALLSSQAQMLVDQYSATCPGDQISLGGVPADVTVQSLAGLAASECTPACKEWLLKASPLFCCLLLLCLLPADESTGAAGFHGIPDRVGPCLAHLCLSPTPSPSLPAAGVGVLHCHLCNGPGGADLCVSRPCCLSNLPSQTCCCGARRRRGHQQR
jgi:hypothetical protein